MGYSGSNGYPRVEEHPNGDPGDNSKSHHKSPHFHAVNAQGEENIFMYKKGW
jgi:hypothetical protein